MGAERAAVFTYVSVPLTHRDSAMESEDEWPTSAEQFLRTRKVLGEVSGVGLGGRKSLLKA